MSYTKGDYEAVEAIIRNRMPSGQFGPVETITMRALAAVRDDLCAMFARNNPQFDEVRFIKACMPDFVLIYNVGPERIVEHFPSADAAEMRGAEVIATGGAFVVRPA